MARIRRLNIFTGISASLRFGLFWLIVFLQLPLIVLLPRGRFSVAYMRVFMWFLVFLTGIRIRVHGTLSRHRPLLVVTNHISLFEIATYPIAFGGSFVAKKEIESWPLVGWVARKFGVIFVDRRPSHAADALKMVQETVTKVKYPMFLFPEGTTTNGAYVKAFKSSLFNFVENSDVMVQPMAMRYTFRDGTPISDADLAEHFAYFNNKDMECGPYCSRERSAFAQIFHVMLVGGFNVEINVLPIPDLRGMDRKQIATTLHEIVSQKYTELKQGN